MSSPAPNPAPASPSPAAPASAPSVSDLLKAPAPSAPTGQSPAPPPALKPLEGVPEWAGAWDRELQELVLNKAWKDPKDAAHAYAHAQKVLRTSPEQVLKIPTTPDDPGWEKIYAQLGRPEKPEGYDFGEVAKPEAGDPDVVGGFRGEAHTLGLSQRQAEGIYKWFEGFSADLLKQQEGRAESERLAQDAKDEGSLRKLWGREFDAAMLRSRAAATRFGIDAAELIDKLGLEKSALLLEKLGRTIGEGQAPPLGGGAESVSGTPAWAHAEIQKRRRDDSFMKAYRAGDSQAKAELDRLYEQAYPQT